jgi:hypothetical protein
MTLTSHVLASGKSWSVSDVVCHAGPHDRPYQEQHDTICVAAVTEGTFQYRSTYGSVVLAPGSLLLGAAGCAFECGHEHGTGDRCIAFNVAPDVLEAIAAAVPGARRTTFAVSCLPPLPVLAPLLAAAEAARDDGDEAELEELTLRLVGGVISTLDNGARVAPSASRRDEQRITRALRRDGRGRADCAGRLGPRSIDERVSFSADVSAHARRHAASIRSAHPPASCGGAASRIEPIDLGRRPRRRLQRLVDFQPPLSTGHGRVPERLP